MTIFLCTVVILLSILTYCCQALIIIKIEQNGQDDDFCALMSLVVLICWVVLFCIAFGLGYYYNLS